MTSEHEEQTVIVQYIRMAYPDVLFWSTPNGARLVTNRADIGIAAARMNRLKSEGLLPGVPDLIIAEARGPYHAFALEMKGEKGRTSPAQETVLEMLRARRWYCAVARGADQAIRIIDAYLQG